MKSVICYLLYLFLAATFMQGCISSSANNATSKKQFYTQSKNEIHLDLAKLYLSPKNPGRDTIKAASELEMFLKTTPQGNKRDDAENILMILNEIHRNKTYITELQKKLEQAQPARDEIKEAHLQIEKLIRENSLLKKRQKELLADNNKLEKTIEKLKFLDLNLEKKRKDFR